MLVYILLLFVPAVFALLAPRTQLQMGKKMVQPDLTMPVFFLIFLLVLCLRGLYIGNDTATYKELYEAMPLFQLDHLFVAEFEPGYMLFSKLCSGLHISFRWFLFFVSLFSLLPLYLYYRRVSENAFLTIVLFLVVAPFSMYFSGLRQILAMGLGIPVFCYAKEKKIVRALLLVILAICFHKSAFVLLLLFPICFFRITKKWLWFVIPLFGLVLSFNGPIFLFLLSSIGDLYTGAATQTGAYTTLILLVLFTVFSFVIPDEQQMDDETIALRNVLLLALFLQPFAAVNLLAMRFNYYFLIFIPVLIPRIMKRCKPQFTGLCQFATVVIAVVFIAYFYINLLEGGGLNIYPYVPYWRTV